MAMTMAARRQQVRWNEFGERVFSRNADKFTAGELAQIRERAEEIARYTWEPAIDQFPHVGAGAVLSACMQLGYWSEQTQSPQAPARAAV